MTRTFFITYFFRARNPFTIRGKEKGGLPEGAIPTAFILWKLCVVEHCVIRYTIQKRFFYRHISTALMPIAWVAPIEKAIHPPGQPLAQRDNGVRE